MPKKSLRLDSKNLSTLFQAYGLPFQDRGLVLFGLRGAKPLSKNASWTEAGELEVAGVDYEHLQCTLGIWDPKQERILLALGSTVPHADNVAKSARRQGKLKGRGTNQLEPGYYHDLTKGEHLQGKPKGHAALRQTAFRFYRRGHHPAPYRKTDPLFFGNPYDNLHGAWNLDGDEPGFSSSGCLVVAGMPHCPRLPESRPNRGAWKSFHAAIYAARQKAFSFALVSARESWEVLGEKNPKPRLIYGSQSAEVGKLMADLERKGLYSPPKKKVADSAVPVLGSGLYRAWNAAGLKGYGDVLGS